MAKILNIDKGLKVNFTAAKNRLAGPRRLSATSAPQGRRLEVGEQVAGRVNDSLPPTKHFFERIGVDILIVIWEFVHNGKLTDFLALMLSSRQFIVEWKRRQTYYCKWLRITLPLFT